MVERDLKRLKVLFLADGNNRARGLNQGYDAGGKNVVKIAQHLAERGDVAKMLACIMSEENAEKRSDDFFEKMYQAFVALGVRINTSGLLVNEGIRMEVEGDLEGLAKRGPAAALLVEMIETVCGLTEEIADPRLRLALGVNYDKDIALDHGVDIVFRSGMEEPGTMRLSGLRSHHSIHNIGSTTLWPDLTLEEVSRELDHSKRIFSAEPPELRLGHNVAEIAAIVERTCEMIRESADITLPYIGKPRDLVTVLNSVRDLHTDKPLPPIKLYDKEAELIAASQDHESSEQLLVRLVPGTFRRLPENHEASYEAIIYPSSRKARFLLPERPVTDYANVYHTETCPTAICSGIKRAIDFAQNYESLKGAERVSTSVHKPVVVPSETAVDAVYSRRLHGLVESFLAWAPTINAPIDTPEKLKAYVNYIVISFFIAYNPDDLQRGMIEGDALGLAKWLIKYMQGVYTGDEDIFDVLIAEETAEERLDRLKESRDYLKACLALDTRTSLPQTTLKKGNTMIKVAYLWQDFKRQFAATADRGLFRDWVKDLSSLYDCSVNEYDPNKTENSLVDMLMDQDATIRQKALLQMEEDYFPRTPVIVERRIKELIEHLHVGSTDQQQTLREIRVWLYLTDIKTTIGAGLVLRTVALGFPANTVTDEQVRVLDETCSFFDYFVRLANDLSDSFKRSRNDQDPKDDSCKIMIREIERGGEKSPARAKIQGLAELKIIYDWMQKEFKVEMMKFAAVWPEMAEMYARADYVKDLYKEGHFRTTDLEGMVHFLRKYKAGNAKG